MSKKILYFNNCWFTNVGEAFIDIGSTCILEQLFNDKQDVIGNFSNMTQIYSDNLHASGIKNSIKEKICGKNIVKRTNDFVPLDYFEADYIVAAGMFATKDALDSYFYRGLKKARNNGSKILLLGIGGIKYDDDERKAFVQILNDIKPEIMTTRDLKTYSFYKDYTNCIRGIDSAMWVRDVYNPKGFAKDPYTLITFNYIDEPIDLELLKDTKVIRPYHFPFALQKEIAERENLMLSDSPYDYLTLYANASCVYTDLVHATLISLGYGIPVKYHKYDQRSQCFDAIDGIKKTEDGFLFLDQELLANQKRKIIESIRKYIV